MEFTANQLILLLQIYRGTLESEHRIGTFENDVLHLLNHGFIMRPSKYPYQTTALADKWIRDHLLKGPK